MDHKTVINLNQIDNEVNTDKKKIKIIAVSKTFSIPTIMPLLNFGHIHYGENKVQEAVQKWTELKKKFNNIKLHLVGKLQTNKVKFILPLFDYIHSLDNLKLAEKISNEQKKRNFTPKIFIQVNIGNEVSKNGIELKDLEMFFETCKNKLNLNIIGLMCIPPMASEPKKFFKKMNELNHKLNLRELSMGMSNDYKSAIDNGATFIRVGTKIFGNRINQS